MDGIHFQKVVDMGKSLNLEPVASSRPIMHDSSRRELTDILACIKLKKIIDNIDYSAQKIQSVT